MNWQRRIARTAERLERRLDRVRQGVDAALGPDARPIRIEAYRGFGTPERLFLRGRVLRGSPIPPADELHDALTNLGNMLRRFESDEVAGAQVRVRCAGSTVAAMADEEGFFEAWLTPPQPLAADRLWHEATVELLAPEPPLGAAAIPGTGAILVPPVSAEIGIISDLDDTVVRTDAASVLRMARTVFLGNARTRVPFPGVAAFYQALQQGAGRAAFNPIFYVSSSPWNLYDLLTEFLTVQKIPLGPLMLRDWGITPEELLPTGHGVHKLGAIRRILNLYPGLPFVLIGDSGQEDPEIYHKVVHDFPNRIAAVYIRNVSATPERPKAIRTLAVEVERAGSTLLLMDDTLAAAEHAAAQGWIAADAVAAVRAEARAAR